MAPKAKRGRKPKTQENVIDSTSEADAEILTKNGAELPVEKVANGSANNSPVQTGKKKQATKRTAPVAVVEQEVVEEVPTKRGRGSRAKAAQLEPVPEPAKPAKAKRGAAKKAEVEKETPVAKEEVQKSDENGTNKRGRGRGKAAAAKEEPAIASEPAQKDETKGTKRSAAAAAKKGKGSKEATETTNGTKAKEESVEPPAPSKGRGRKAAASKEEPIEVAVETKVAEKPKRGRKVKAADDVVAEEPVVETPVEKNEEIKPTKKGTKRAAPASTSSKTSSPPPPVKTTKKRGAASKKPIEEQITDDRDDSVPVDGEFDGDHEEIITAKKAKTTTKKASAKSEVKSLPASTDYSDMNLSIDKEYNMKISSWNVAGLRAWLKKSGADYVKHEQPDIICLQEIKCIPDDIPDEARFAGYHPYWLCKPGGHAGVALYSKIMPYNVEYGIGDAEQDDDGRILTAEFEKFFVICVYVPNAGRKLVTLAKRLRWNKLFEEYVQKLNAKKPVIICGDMNVAHSEIDLTNPKPNKNNAGFTQEERSGMTDLLNLGYVDTYRHFYPKQERAYTFWAYFMNSRAKDVGWRLDYFIVSERFLTKCVDNVIRSKVMGSDHCPITLFLNV